MYLKSMELMSFDSPAETEGPLGPQRFLCQPRPGIEPETFHTKTACPSHSHTQGVSIYIIIIYYYKEVTPLGCTQGAISPRGQEKRRGRKTRKVEVMRKRGVLAHPPYSPEGNGRESPGWKPKGDRPHYELIPDTFAYNRMTRSRVPWPHN